MIIKIIGVIIGILVFGAGIYYLKQAAGDPESKKIYSIVSAIGAIVAVVSGALLVLS